MMIVNGWYSVVVRDADLRPYGDCIPVYVIGFR